MANLTTAEKKIVTLLAITLNGAPTSDLLAEVANAAEQGVPAEVLLNVVFNNSIVTAQYPGYANSATTASFLSTLVDNATIGTSISATTKAAWKAALVNDYQSYTTANPGATHAGFTVWLVNVLESATFPTGSDLATLQTALNVRADAAAATVEAHPTSVYVPSLGFAQFAIGTGVITNPGDLIKLTVGQDDLIGTSGDDTFQAHIFDNQNTLQSGDAINGGAGNDTLQADIGNSQNFSITPELTNVENVIFRVQAVQSDTADNNVGGATLLDTLAQIIGGVASAFNPVFPAATLPITDPTQPGGLNPTTTTAALEAALSLYVLTNFRGTQIDAERSVGVTHWESNNSRSDLLIEDVRILDNQITKDITIEFSDSDPGNVDFAVYIDQQSLRKAGTTASDATLILELLDTRAAVAGDAPLKNSPFDGFTFFIDGNAYEVSSPAIDAAQTYPELLAAIKAALAAAAVSQPILANFDVSLGATFTAVDTQSGIPVTGTSIVLTNKGPGVVAAGNYTTATGDVPGSSGLHLEQFVTAPDVTDALITSTVILDNVGRGATGGDLVIGSLSVGDTANSQGVQQFDIKVEQTSQLQSIASTNNTLEVVNLSSGTTHTDFVNGVPVVRYGNLTVLGTVDVAGSALFDFDNSGNSHKFTNTAAVGDLPLPGAILDEASGFGFVDIREINAADFNGAAFKGDIDVSVLLTERVVEKYLDRADTQADPAADNVDFSYRFGDGNDHFALAIDSVNLVRAGTSEHEDFNLVIDGGNGNDVIKTVIDANTQINLARAGEPAEASLPNWYNNSKLNANLEILGGAGNDEVHTLGTGDWVVDLGTGDDTYYADNTGGKSAWVRNDLTAVSSLNDIRSGTNESFALFGAKLTVTLETDSVDNADSYTSLAVTIPSTGYHSSDLQINQAIKAAINSDPVLSKLLIAEDGPANTLVISSLIDGTDQTLTYNVTAPTAASLTAADVSGYAQANGLTGATAATVATSIGAAIAALNAVAADNGFHQYQGSTDSFNTADNTVTGGTGADVLVLGTGALSNDIVKYAGLDNGTDTIVNFDVGHTLNFTGAGSTFETVTLTFADSDGSPAAETIIFEGQTIVLSAPTVQGVIPAEDVAYQFATQLSTANWTVTHTPNTDTVTLTANTYGDRPDLTAASFTGSYVDPAGGNGSITPVVNTQGTLGTTPGTLGTFTVTFDETQTAADAAGSFTFDGATIAYAEGDGGVTLANKIAAGAFADWTVSGPTYVGTKVSVTFTENAVGVPTPHPIGTAADFDLGTNSIVGTVAGTQGTTTGTGAYVQTIETGIDYLDFSSYAGVDHVVVNGATLVGGALPTASDTYVSLTENTTAHPGAGVYTIELHTLNGAGADTVALIGVADFGAHKDFIADNFIV